MHKANHSPIQSLLLTVYTVGSGEAKKTLPADVTVPVGQCHFKNNGFACFWRVRIWRAAVAKEGSLDSAGLHYSYLQELLLLLILFFL